MKSVHSLALAGASALLIAPAFAAEREQTSPDDLMSLARSVASKVMACWKPAPGLKATDIVVLDISLNRDGTLAGPPQINLAKTGTPLPPAGAIDAAKHAVERCAPYKLPQDLYSRWKVQRVTFNPASLFH